MIKKFQAPCSFNGSVSPFSFWLSDDYKNGNHPLYFQNDWLSKSRGGTLDSKISEGIAQIAKISEENKMSFEYLFMIAMDAALKTATESTTTTAKKTTTSNNDSDDSGYDSDRKDSDASNMSNFNSHSSENISSADTIETKVENLKKEGESKTSKINVENKNTDENNA